MSDEQGEGQLIAIIEKNQREQLRVSIQSYKGYTYADLRLWAKREDGLRVPTPKGVTANGRALPELIEALHRRTRFW